MGNAGIVAVLLLALWNFNACTVTNRKHYFHVLNVRAEGEIIANSSISAFKREITPFFKPTVELSASGTSAGGTSIPSPRSSSTLSPSSLLSYLSRVAHYFAYPAERETSTRSNTACDESTSFCKNSGVRRLKAVATAAIKPLAYGNGPLMVNGINVYFIYYGRWPLKSGQSTLEAFVKDINSASPDPPSINTPRKWWAIALQYYQIVNGVKSYVSNKVTFAKAVYDNYSLGKYLNEDQVWAVVSSKISKGLLPKDVNGVYFVLGSSDVSSVGFCTDNCGWHTNEIYQGTSIKYSFVGDPTTTCPLECTGLSTVNAPTGFRGADAMVVTLGHELVEAATDPEPFSGWVNFNKEENADICAEVYGGVITQKVGSSTITYNMVGPSGLKYYMQGNYDLKTGKCVMSATTPPKSPPPKSPPPARRPPPPKRIRRSL